jgi:hypothetical protein
MKCRNCRNERVSKCYCQECLVKMREYNRWYYRSKRTQESIARSREINRQKQKAARAAKVPRKCNLCSRVMKGKHEACFSCRRTKVQSDYNRERRERLLAAGLCVQCASRKANGPYGTRTMCGACAERVRQYAARRREHGG